MGMCGDRRLCPRFQFAEYLEYIAQVVAGQEHEGEGGKIVNSIIIMEQYCIEAILIATTDVAISVHPVK